jgi:purine-binding chemotaxis protein CheW
MNDFIEENPFAFDLPTLDLTRFSEPQTSRAVGEKYLVFFLGEELYALDSNTVAEVAASLAVTKLPNVPDWLLGITNLRGEIMSVINLSAILGDGESAPFLKPKFIVLRSRIFESGVAFTVSRISEVVTLPDETIENIADEKTPHIFGKTFHKTQTLNLIDAEKILSTLRIN